MLTVALMTLAGLLLAVTLTVDRGTVDRGARDRRRWIELIALGAPLALFWAVNHGALGSWWLRDDPCLLRSVYEHGVARHLYDPDVWRPLSGTLLMPWSLVSLGLDSRLFGLAPGAFYAHQLLSFSVLIGLLYGFLRTFLRPASATVAVSLVAVSPAAFSVAQELANRHYLEGLAFALASWWCFRRLLDAPRRSLWIHTTLGVAFYLLAAAAKEVYVPLPLVLVLLPVGSLPTRIRRAAPWGVAALVYGAWRIHMLGWSNSLPASAYGTRAPAFRLAEVSRWSEILGLQGTWPALLAVSLTVAALAIVARDRRTLVLAAGLIAIVALPLVPVASELAPRHLLLPVLLAAVVLARALDRLDLRFVRWTRPVALLLVVGATVALYRSPVHREHERTVQAFRGEGEVVLRSAEDGLLLTRLPDGFYLGCLAELRDRALGPPPGPGFVGDGCLASRYAPGQPVRRVGRDGLVELTKVPAPCDQSKPLEVYFRHDDRRSRVEWRLGPWSKGSYQALMVFSVDGSVRIGTPIPLDREGSLAWTLAQPLRWIIRYRSPKGWTTLSPILSLEAGGEVRYRGSPKAKERRR